MSVARRPGFPGNGQISVWLLMVVLAPALAAQTDQAIYTDSLQNSWVDWGWATRNYNNTSPVHSGTRSISVTSSNWQALYLHHPAQNGSGFSNLTFWVNGGTGGQVVQVQATRNGNAQPAVVLTALPANAWREEKISLTALGVASAADFDGFWIQVQNSGLAPTFYVDDISLTAGSNPPVSGAITLDAALNQHPISPLIYGVAFGSSSQLAELNAPLHRSGGNAQTRYNWLLNARNHAADWYFECLDAGSATPGALGDDHVATSRKGGSEPILTVPMIGWMPLLAANRGKAASYSIQKYGPQTDNDWQWFADAGNGISVTNNTPITWNDPNDVHFFTNAAFQQAWIRHLTNRWGVATNGGVRYYCMDNEHTLWNSTHRDVHPVGTTMQEIRDKFFEYGEAVKAVDPDALLLAPEEWGWTGYFYSGYDAQWAAAHGNWNPAAMPDRGTNGGMDYMPWFLDQARQHAASTGQRLLDYFTLHIYPQGDISGSDTSTSMQLLRNQSTRSLWDPNYVDPTWINSVIKLIPRMKQWVAAYYPGTKIGITEYNWGAENHINGAVAQADVLGIFGREGLDLATRWTTPDTSTPTYKAMKLYRNYDGNQSTFGETSVSATGPNPDYVTAYAARRSTDGALTVIVINKQLDTNVLVSVTLTNFLPAGVAQVWQLTAANVIARPGDLSFTGCTLTNTLPAQSVTLFIVPPGTPPTLSAPAISNNTFTCRLDGQAGQRYVLQASSNFLNWLPLQTNLLTSASWPIALPATNVLRFYRAQWVP